MKAPRPIPAPVTGAARSAQTRAGADVNAQDNLGETRLHAAAETGTAGVVRHLLACGAAVNSKSNAGSTPLMRAIIYGEPAVVNLLQLRAGQREYPDRLMHCWPRHLGGGTGPIVIPDRDLPPLEAPF